ncbi:MAG: recombination regulator RecX [Proteobacteria bacterium]|nr:recombination regulator RecX [Pseudomonadota bacterium]MBU2261272.1 recombination regulator RecX [Pseudomonadota bacterium]
MRGDDALLAKAEKKAYRLLALRAHSEKELRTKLREGGFAAPDIGEVIHKCRELGYLDDPAFARQRARELAVNRLLGNRRIALDLKERGIPEALCREAIAEVRGELSEEEAIGRLIRKKTRGAAVAELDEREMVRIARALMGKGFPVGLIMSGLKKTQEEGFHDDDGE